MAILYFAKVSIVLQGSLVGAAQYNHVSIVERLLQCPGISGIKVALKNAIEYDHVEIKTMLEEKISQESTGEEKVCTIM